MNTKKIKELVAEYPYYDLGFPIILKDVLIVEDRGYCYPMINHSAIMFQAAYSLVTEHQKLDGARLLFIRRFLGLSLDQFADVIGDISKSTLHKWERDKEKICDLDDEQLRSIYFELRSTILSQIGKKMDKVILRNFSDTNDIPPLNIEVNSMVAI